MDDKREAYALAASRVAMTAGIFCAVLAALLLANSVWMYRGAAHAKLRLLDSREMLPLKTALRAKSGDAELTARIREVDQQVRKDYFRHKELTERGGVLLVGGMFVFLASLQAALLLRRPRFRDPRLSPRPQNPAAAWSEKTLAAGGTALVLASLMLAFVWGVKPSWVQADQVVSASPGPASQPESGAASTAAPAGGVPAPAAPAYPPAEEVARNWGRFRGPTGQGVANFPGIPEAWNAAEGTNILWKTVVPAHGENSPVVWGDRIFLTGATEERREVLCFDASSGAILWREPVSTPEGAREKPPKVMKETGFAAPTPVTDGQRVIAMFANGEIAAFDFQGKRLWARHLGTPDNSYGHAASLAMWRDRVIVLYDQGEAESNLSKILALNAATGETAWSTPRPGIKESWATPIVVPDATGEQIITSADPFVIAYHPENGKELWKVPEVISGEVAPSPAFGDGRVFVANDGAWLASIGLDGKVGWKWDEGSLPDTCSLLCDGPRVYLLVYGVINAFDAQTGKLLWEHDLESECQASPSLVNGKLWILTKEGVMIMGQADASGFKETGRAALGEECGASPAFAPGRVYLRSKEHLFAIGAKEAPAK